MAQRAERKEKNMLARRLPQLIRPVAAVRPGAILARFSSTTAPAKGPQEPVSAGPHLAQEELCLYVTGCDGAKGKETCINCYLRGGTKKVNCAESRAFEAEQKRKAHFTKDTTA
uniref:Uncharacterized protein n=2 Tax=Hemiselmis andersenii TaxID=464988 RepID=A0A7S0TNV9_HEMAN|mmetsp:Transcript_21025/g.48193  ORF Transcript_21025/g.48193 Transcript_21025/m.48193 type:complete len:114 (+) Transcript_21025:3-344(+)